VADPSTILEFLALSERLKCEPRHSSLSNGQQESVAEHCWQMALMALVVHRKLREPVDIEKTLKMILTHDLVEAETGARGDRARPDAARRSGRPGDSRTLIRIRGQGERRGQARDRARPFGGADPAQFGGPRDVDPGRVRFGLHQDGCGVRARAVPSGAVRWREGPGRGQDACGRINVDAVKRRLGVAG
jgi:HD domain